MATVFTTAGLTYYQSLVTSSADLEISGIVIENLNAGERYDAVPTSTPVLAEGHTRRTDYTTGTALSVTVIPTGANISLSLELDDDQARTAWAVYVYAEGLSDPFIVVADASTVFFTKASNTPGLINIGWTLSQGAPTSLRVTWSPTPLASQAIAEAGTSNSYVMTPLRTQQWWNDQTVHADKVGQGTLNIARIPDLTANKITDGTFDADRIPNLNADKISSGVLDTDRIPSLGAGKITGGVLDTDRIPDLNADKITDGVFNVSRIPDLHADKISDGILDIGRIPDLNTRKITSGILNHARLPKPTDEQARVGQSDNHIMTPRDVLLSIEENAVSAPRLVYHTTHPEPWLGGDAATLQSLNRPYDGHWLSGDRATIKAYGPLEGCSAVTGGIRFNWDDSNITSIDMLFEVSRGSYYNEAPVESLVKPLQAGRHLAGETYNLRTTTASEDAHAIAVTYNRMYIADDTQRRIFVFELPGYARQVSEEYIWETSDIPANEEIRGIDVDDEFIYILTDRPGAAATSGANVHKFRNAPPNIEHVQSYSIGHANVSDPIDISVIGSLFYIAHHSDSLYVYDSTTPANSRTINMYPTTSLLPDRGPVKAMAIHNNRVYRVLGDTGTQVGVFNIYTNMNDNELYWRLGDASPAIAPGTDNDQMGMDIDNNKAYIVNNQWVHVYSVATLEPRLGIVMSDDLLTVADMVHLDSTSLGVNRLRSGPITVPRNAYLLFNGEQDIAPFQVTGTILGITRS